MDSFSHYRNNVSNISSSFNSEFDSKLSMASDGDGESFRVSPDRHNKSSIIWEPMDVSEERGAEESEGEGSPQEIPGIKDGSERNRPVKSTLYPVLTNKKVSLPTYVKVILLSLLVLIFGVLFKEILNTYNGHIDVEAIKNDLNSKVHHQKSPVKALVNSLNTMYLTWPKRVKILGFIGRSGVGKTFIANVAKKHFHHSFVYDLPKTLLNNTEKQNEIINSLYKYHCNLMIMDDLKVSDSQLLFKFAEKITDEETLVLILAVFSIQEVDNNLNYTVNYHHLMKLRKEFDNTSLYNDVVVFNEFNKTHAADWVIKKLQAYEVNPEKHNPIVRAVLKNHDIDRHGFKGLHSKLAKELWEQNVFISD